MIRELIYENTHLPMYRNALDAYAARHRAVASNLANASTPGHIPVRVSFEEQLSRSLDRGKRLQQPHPRHLNADPNPKQVRHAVWQDRDAASDNGANGVVPEREIATLATNTMHYAMVAKRTAGLFTAVRRLTRLK